MVNKNLESCRVCGYTTHGYYPWGQDGKTPSFDICECCGVEFGYEDSSVDTIKNYRKKWLENGAQWFKPKYRPDNWDLYKQLANITNDYN